MQATVKLTQRVARRLGKIDGVVAVALGGSWARGGAHPGSDVDLGICSDVDLGIYYRDERRPAVEELDQLAQELGYRDPTEHVTDFGAGDPGSTAERWCTEDTHPSRVRFRVTSTA